MKSIFPLALLTLILMSQTALGDLVYSFVDHGVPDHTLTGTIDVTDSAPDDGVLDFAEITAVQLTVVGSNVNISISSDDDSFGIFLLGDVFIDEDAISIAPPSGSSEFSGIEYHLLDASSAFYSDTMEDLGSVQFSSASYSGGGANLVSVDLPFETRVHAVAVPEPGSFALFAIAGLAFSSARRRRQF